MSEQVTVKLLKKLTTKNVMGVKIKAPEAQTYLYTIYGLANGIRKGESTLGPWTLLRGTFEAVRDGVRYVSSECALPQPLHNMLVDALSKEGAKDIQFACKVIIAPANNAYGYEYFAEPIVQQSENDALSALRNEVNKVLAIPAPTVSEEKHEIARGADVSVEKHPKKK